MNRCTRVAARAAMAVMVVLIGCGSDEQTGDRDVSRCAALEELAEAQPPAGSLNPEEWAAAYDAYADAALRAAQVAPADEATVLTDFAALMRLIAEDPTSPALAERVDEIGSSVFDLAATAERDCGVTFGL